MAWISLGFVATYWKLMYNDSVLRRPTVDVTDANMCYSFPEFSYAGGMLVYILLSLLHLFLSFCHCDFKEVLLQCGNHCYKWR